jgi:hypothetical protein
MAHLILYHIPISPFCQRPDILRTLKGQCDEAGFRVIDIVRHGWTGEQPPPSSGTVRIGDPISEHKRAANGGNPIFFKLKGEY